MLNDILKQVTEAYNWYSDLTKANHFLAAVVFGGVISAIWMSIKTWWSSIKGFAYGRFFIEMRTEYTNALTVQTSEAEDFCAKLINHVSTNSVNILKPSTFQPNHPYKVGVRFTMKTPVVPGVGRHWIIYDGVFMRMFITNNDKGGSVRLMTFAWNKKTFEKIVISVTKPPEKAKDWIVVMTNTGGGGWNKSVVDKRSVDTVITKKGAEIIERINKWKANHAANKFAGLPGKLSFLLSGPPGTGKSSIITAIASVTDLPIYNIKVGSTSDSGIASLTTSIPSMSIVVIEDAPFTVEDMNNPASRVTPSTLLNFLEGTGGLNNCIVIATHNNPEKFDPRFLQAGRVGHQIVLNHWEAEEFTCFVERYYPGREYCVASYLSKMLVTDKNWDKHFDGYKRLKKSPAAIATLAADYIDDYIGFVKALDIDYEMLTVGDKYKHTPKVQDPKPDVPEEEKATRPLPGRVSDEDLTT